MKILTSMENIIIKTLENGCFDVSVGDKSTEQVTFDEMLGVVAQLTVPDNKRCLSWLKTKEQHEAFNYRAKSTVDGEITEVDFEEIKE